MMKYKEILYMPFLFFTFLVVGQNHKFGKVSKEELLEKFYKKDSSAVAAVLYRNVSVSYDYVKSSGFQIITEIHERVKIYDKNGFDYATVEEKLYLSNKDNESFSGLKAYTYNWEGNEIVKSKLKSSDAFSEKTSKYYKEEKFTMPNVKEGSVIEYQYKIVSPFSYSIDEIVLQYDIPISKQEIRIVIPEYYSFKTNMKGYLSVMPKNSIKQGKINFQTKSREQNGFGATTSSFSSNSIDYTENVTEILMVDVPALKDEPYVNNMNNYRSSINYEIQYVKFPNSSGKSYTTNWEKVVKTIYDSDNFGKQLHTTKYFKDDLETVLAQYSDNGEKINAIFSYVKSHMNWNGYIGKYTDEGVKEAYKKRTGSTADINLMLVAMLKEAGFKANPVLTSTRDNGVPLFPTREGFNYVLAMVEYNGKNMLLDACNKYTEPNLLPIRTINWSGRVIDEDGSSLIVPLVPKKPSKRITAMSVTLKDNGNLEGKQREILTFYNAYLFRNNNKDISEDSYLEKKENRNNGMEISNYAIDNKEVLGKSIIETFDFYVESQADVIGEKIFFSPLFFHTENENPFKLEERNYPIDFVFPWEEKYTVNIKIPVGYKVSSMPENTKVMLPENMGMFTYQIIEKTNMLQVVVDTKLNQAVIPVHGYASLKEFYKKIVEKETEKVVLSKI
ncbi:DUF3857 domain-containing protein [Costertonia aggregata]|uniref:DUF3857 domain-containing protein n=1 Tax=Costertonia aggregata TaxID=343403 RepID=A0A7H9ALT6_9FLAO|nr:DUF3857 domain-containing protein [Costertonia aggregata]QLG44426.1 DUF3857 domain-containing protein [Costertonia aggregata]